MNKNPRTQHTGDSPVGGDVDRRSFLKLTGAGLVAALPISTAPWAGPAAAQSTPSIKREAYGMKTRKLGRLEVSELGFGTMTLSGGHYGPGVDRAQGIRNQPIIQFLRTFGARKGATPAQIALAWLMAQKPWIVPIPGTTNMDHLRENVDAVKVQLTPADLREVETAFAGIEIYGGRMDARQMAQIDQDG